MNDSITIGSPSSRLERPLQGRVVTGVCAGLARHFDIDITLVRIVVAVTSFLGGAGVILYVAATLLVPEEGQERPMLRGGPRRGRGQLLLGATLVAIGAANLLGDIGLGLGGHTVWGAAMLAIGAFFLLRTQELRADDGTGQRDDAQSQIPDDAPTAIVPTATPIDPVTMSAVADTPSPRRRSHRGTLITLGGVLLATAGAIALLTTVADGASWQTVAGAAVLAAGVALAAGSLLGASPLIVIPLLLVTGGAMALQASDVDLHGGVGTRAYRPASVSDLHHRYRLGIGELRLDLRDAALPPGRTLIRAKLGIGDLTVRVPRDASVRVVGHAGAGELRLLGETHDGTSVDGSATTAGPRDRSVVIDADVGFGSIDVIAADGALPNDDHEWSRR